MTAPIKQIAVTFFLTAIFSFLMVAAALPREDLWQRLNTEILKLSQQGKYTQAIYVAQNSIKLAEKSFGTQDPRVAASMNNLATLYRIVGRSKTRNVTMTPPGVSWRNVFTSRNLPVLASRRTSAWTTSGSCSRLRWRSGCRCVALKRQPVFGAAGRNRHSVD